MDGSVKSKPSGHLDTEDKLNLFENQLKNLVKQNKVSLLSTVVVALTSCGGGGGEFLVLLVQVVVELF